MARPQRNNVDYFPFICKEGDTTKYIDNTYGNDGFATWVRILRALAITDYHYLDLSNRKKLLTLCSTCKVTEDFLLKFLTDLAEFNEIDPDLWKDQIVWSDRFIETIEDAYAKRSNQIAKKEEVLRIIEGLRGSKLGKSESKGPVKPQSKVEKSKVEETRVIPAGDNSPLNVWPSFENFWDTYDKKVDRPKCELKWKKIEQGAREKIMSHLENYIRGTPDKQYRKNPATYLHNKSWENEQVTNGEQQSITGKAPDHINSLMEGLERRHG